MKLATELLYHLSGLARGLQRLLRLLQRALHHDTSKSFKRSPKLDFIHLMSEQRQ